MPVRGVVSRQATRRLTARIVAPASLVAALLLAAAIPAGAHAPARHHAVTSAVRITALRVPAATYPGMSVAPAITTGPTHRGRVKVVYYVTVTVRVKYRVRYTVKRHHKVLYRYRYEYKRVQRRERRVRFPIRTIPSTQEWLVLDGPLQSDLVSLTPQGKLQTLATGLLPVGSVPPGQVNSLPSYGSIQIGGYVWLLGYSVAPATLYAVGPDDQVVAAQTLAGAITSFTAGPDNTIEAADNTGYIDRCAITRAPAATCVQVKVPTTFAGGQIDAIAQGGGRVWFTDNDGELGSFNPVNDAFAGPYGDIAQDGQKAGEASAVPGTIVSTSNSRMYVAAGQDTNPLFQNNLIRVIDPRRGTLLHSYSRGLTNVIALTAGSDGNVWFLDEKSAATGAGEVGVLNTKTGSITEYPLPKGYELPATGATISAGPAGSDTLFFNLQTVSGSKPAIGEVTVGVAASAAERRRRDSSLH